MGNSKIVNVPIEFRFQDPFFYPSDNEIDFEYWLSMNVKDEDIEGERHYLPITWTAYYKFWQYGENAGAIQKLQVFLDKLDKSKKYWSVVQFDLGILNDVSGLDIKVFSMAGQPMDYPLPLISQPHKFKPLHETKDIFACFVGANTHPIRSEIFKLSKNADYYISCEKHTLDNYCSILAHSLFSLCPRGVSCASFRVMESIFYKSIPVYVSDFFIEPHNVPFEQYGVKITFAEVPYIDSILSSITKAEITSLQETGAIFYKELYTFEANRKLILNNI